MDAKAAETVKSINALAPRRRSKMKMERSRNEDFEVASSLVKKQFGKSTGTDRSNQKQKSLIKQSNLDPAEALASFVPAHDGAILLKLNILMSRGLEAIEGIFLVCSAALHFVSNFAVNPRTGAVVDLTSGDAKIRTNFC